MESNIISDLKKIHGISCTEITPIIGGFLNKKLKI